MHCRNALGMLLVGLSAASFGGEQDRYVESFDGVGEFGAENDLGPATGLDNPGWVIPETALLADGGLQLPTVEVSGQIIWRWVDGSDSFRNEVRINNVSIGVGSSAISSPLVFLNHTPGIDEDNSALGRISIGVDLETTGAPRVSVETGGRRPGPLRIFRDIGDPSVFEDGTDMLLAIEFEQDTLDAYFEYDLNLNDDEPGTKLGPFRYEGEVTDRQNTTFSLTRYEHTNEAFGVLDSWSLGDLIRVPGDFDGDGLLTSNDIDMLSAEVLSGANIGEFDLNADDLVDAEDRRVWVRDLAVTSFGDANLDGYFDSRDFVSVFQAAEYEDSITSNSRWDEGDWSGDGEFDSADFVVAFQGGTYEGGEVTVSVPEPTFEMIWLFLPFVGFRCRPLSLNSLIS